MFFDITRSGNNISYTSSFDPIEVGVSNSSVDDRGTDVVVYDINNNAVPDLVVADSYCTPLPCSLYYYFGPISSSGAVSTWTAYSSNIDFPTDDVGFTIVDPAARIATLTYANTTSSNFYYPRQHVLHLATDASIDASILQKHSSLKQIPFAPNGIGAGDAIDLGELGYKDQITSWADTTKGYYTIDWDSRLYSHG